MTDIKPSDLTAEEYREYEFGDKVYRISDPQQLWARSGGTTHRVMDADGIVHCVPAPGHNGCVLRWKPRNVADPVQF